MGYVKKAKDSAAMQEANSIKTAYLIWKIEDKVDFDIYLENNKLLSIGQVIEPFEGVDTSEENKYLNGFIFTSSKQIKIKVEYDDGQFTMTKIEP